MTDPYTETENCVNRLLGEYEAHEKLIVAVDFDDTVFDFHEKSFSYERVLNLLSRCQNLGFYLVLFTASDKSRHISQLLYMHSKGIMIHSVNQNPIDLPYGKEGKIFYNILLDDKAGLGQACDILEEVVTKIEKEI